MISLCTKLWLHCINSGDDLDDNHSPFKLLMNKIEKIFYQYDINVGTCMQKAICTTIRSAVENVARGNGTSTDKIFDGLSR